jgi:hypothetical protein
MFEALVARPEEVKVLLLLHGGLAYDPDELALWALRARCIPGFFWGIYLGNNSQKEAAMRGSWERAGWSPVCLESCT